jgi:hypothetical protein
MAVSSESLDDVPGLLEDRDVEGLSLASVIGPVQIR